MNLSRFVWRDAYVHCEPWSYPCRKVIHIALQRTIIGEGLTVLDEGLVCRLMVWCGWWRVSILVHSTWEILANLPCWSLLRSASLSLNGFFLLFKERPWVSCGIDLTLIRGISSVWDILLFYCQGCEAQVLCSGQSGLETKDFLMS